MVECPLMPKQQRLDANNGERTRCPTCNEFVEDGFDGANDMPYEICTNVQYRPPLDPIRCQFYASPPQWLAEFYP